MFSGLGSQSGTSHRWGDYTGLVLDVDDCTFFYVNQYQPAGVTSFNWRTRIGKFAFGPGTCTPPALGTAVISTSNCASATPIVGAAIYIGGTLYGTTDGAGIFTVNLPPGTYPVEARYPGLGTGNGTLVVAASGTATLNLCLVGVPSVSATASSLSVESCPPANNAVDPGERVTYSLALTNTGTGPTRNLVATLLAGPNVSAPSAAQSYGVIPPGGTATRTFAWTAVGTCGQPWTATLSLADGALTFPNTTITGTYGALVTTTLFAEAFDGVVAPALPAGWVAANATGTDGILWVTSTATPDTGPNAAFVNDPARVHDKRLTTPVIAMPSGTYQRCSATAGAWRPGSTGGARGQRQRRRVPGHSRRRRFVRERRLHAHDEHWSREPNRRAPGVVGQCRHCLHQHGRQPAGRLRGPERAVPVPDGKRRHRVGYRLVG